MGKDDINFNDLISDPFYISEMEQSIAHYDELADFQVLLLRPRAEMSRVEAVSIFLKGFTESLRHANPEEARDRLIFLVAALVTRPHMPIVNRVNPLDGYWVTPDEDGQYPSKKKG